jgi:hypothetical protein
MAAMICCIICTINFHTHITVNALYNPHSHFVLIVGDGRDAVLDLHVC